MTSVPASEPELPAEAVALSTDYLNHFGEALMLIEMASDDVSVLDDLAQWRPRSYQQHFMASGLRCAPGALLAWEQLSP